MMKFKVYKNEKKLRDEEFNLNDQKLIFIFHGLFGRAKNWHSIALRISSKFDGTIIVFDLRNHGENEPSTEISYSIMVNDVYEFIKKKNIKKFSIIGHSMGGKLGMLFTLLYPQFVKQLFVVDIAPVDYPRDEIEVVDEELLHMRKLLKTSLNDLDLSVRAYNCLKAAEIRTLGDLVSIEISDMMKFRNFGKKSLTELEELVDSKGLSFGMDLAKYNLD